MSGTSLPCAPRTAAEEAYEMEKAAITSYEENWCGWDGPIWPVGYEQCRMQADGYVHPTTTWKVPVTEEPKTPTEEAKL